MEKCLSREILGISLSPTCVHVYTGCLACSMNVISFGLGREQAMIHRSSIHIKRLIYNKIMVCVCVCVCVCICIYVFSHKSSTCNRVFALLFACTFAIMCLLGPSRGRFVILVLYLFVFRFNSLIYVILWILVENADRFCRF